MQSPNKVATVRKLTVLKDQIRFLYHPRHFSLLPDQFVVVPIDLRRPVGLVAANRRSLVVDNVDGEAAVAFGRVDPPDAAATF